MVFGTNPGIEAGSTPGIVEVATKLTWTSLPGVDPLPLKPLSAAYLQGAAPGVVAQSKFVPAVNPPNVLPVFAFTRISITPAVHAASAAVCAAWRWNQKFAKSTPKAETDKRNIPNTIKTKTATCPLSLRHSQDIIVLCVRFINLSSDCQKNIRPSAAARTDTVGQDRPKKG